MRERGEWRDERKEEADGRDFDGEESDGRARQLLRKRKEIAWEYGTG